MKQKTILILFSILLPIFLYAQAPFNCDSLNKVLNDKILFSKSNTSDIVWERITIPEGKELESFEVTPNNELYIGCNNGGVYIDSQGVWDLIGLENNGIADFERSENGDLFIVSSDLYSWDDISIQYISDIYTNPLENVSGKLFGYNGEVIRSLDNGITWEIVYDISSAEMVFAFASTTSDSIFMGTTNWVGEGGGVYLSTDGGDNWEPFGLLQHFVKSMAVDNNNMVYAGNGGHWETGQGGLYRYNYETAIWDTLLYYPYIYSVVFNSENYIYTGFSTSGMADLGGVMHSEDNGETWILDTVGIGNTWVNELQIDNNGFLYALTGYTTKKLYRTTLPVSIKENYQQKNCYTESYPNPAKDYVIISFDNVPSNTSNLSITLHSILGEFVLEQQISQTDIKNGIKNLNISNLRCGYYIYIIKGDNYRAINKFNKQ